VSISTHVPVLHLSLYAGASSEGNQPIGAQNRTKKFSILLFIDALHIQTPIALIVHRKMNLPIPFVTPFSAAPANHARQHEVVEIVPTPRQNLFPRTRARGPVEAGLALCGSREADGP
jgi:hypothetical protein